MKDQFYLILPSNSSMTHYPDNTVTHFITQLPHTLKLPGEWTVALTEIQFPRNFLHFTEKEATIKVSQIITVPPVKVEYKGPPNIEATKAVTKVVNLRESMKLLWQSSNVNFPAGVYTSVNALITSIRESLGNDSHFRIKYNDTAGGIVSFYLAEKECILSDCTLTHILTINSKLCSVLGFEQDISLDFSTRRPHIAGTPASLSRALPDKLFIYTDICESYITGDVQTPLLRIVPVDNTNHSYGAVQTRTFSPAHYIPLLRTEFDTIEIDIRTHTGVPAPFESGTLTATLHFRRIR